MEIGLFWSHIKGMLKLSKRVGYGLIALKHLALYGEQGSASAKLISARYRIPSPLLAKVLQQLARAGFLTAEYGAAGGYRLARDPRRISALEVIRALDGPVRLTSCSTGRGECEQLARCTVRTPLNKLGQEIVKLLANTSIMDLSEGERPPAETAARTPAGGSREPGRSGRLAIGRAGTASSGAGLGAQAGLAPM